jgi:hypothetical protein
MKGKGWLLASALGLAACSAIVSEIELTCKDDCEALNRHHGLGEGDCLIYQCRSDGKGCEKRARDKDGDGVPDKATCGDAGGEVDADLDCDDRDLAILPDAGESCDGVDNDCDGVIDEDVLDGRFVAVPERPLDAPPADLAYSASPDGLLDLVVRYQGGLPALELKQQMSIRVDTGSNCETQGEEIEGCTFAEVAFASMGTAAILAGVNTTGCATGQIRVGASFDRKTFTWQHTADSALRFGVDSRLDDAHRACNGGRGARELSAALLSEANRYQGLLLWREVDVRLRTPPPAPLRGILFDLTSEEGRQRVVTPDNERSELIWDAVGLERAAVVVWPAPDSGGYFIAADALEAIELAFVPRTPASMPLWERLQRGEAIGANRPSHIALALDPGAAAQGPGALGLGAAWREGSTLQFAPVTYDPQGASVLRAGEKVFIADTPQLIDGPRLVYQRDGFRTAPDAPRGGWYVLWMERMGSGTRLVGARVAQADFGAERQFLVGEQAQPGTLFAFPSDGSPQFAYVADAERAELYIGSLGCGRRP